MPNIKSVIINIMRRSPAIVKLSQQIYQNEVGLGKSHKSNLNANDAPDIRQISHIVFDFDGVLTDNKVYVDQHGNESVRCDRADGLGFKILKAAGLNIVIISTEKNPVVRQRSRKLNIECIYGCNDKKQFLEQYMTSENINGDNLTYVGNDTNDYDAMLLAGVRICPSDSHQSIKEISHFVLPTPGGTNIVRGVASVLGIK